MRFFCLLFILFFFVSEDVGATTFSSFTVVRQIENTQYIVRGRIGNTWVNMEDVTHRPYTYWNLSVQENYSDAKLSGDVAIRQPGGQIDDLGYHVPGTAEFRDGEDVVVLLRDTEEAAKEVVGLTSGKYNVFRTDSGKEYLQNGLGIDLKGANGELLEPSAFQALVARVQSHTTTEPDGKIQINPFGHSHDSASLGEPEIPTNIPTKINQFARKPADRSPSLPAPKTENTLEDNNKKPDRLLASQSEVPWFGVVAILLLVAGVAVFLLRRPK